MRPILVLCCAAFVLGVSSADAQETGFVPYQNWWIGPGTTTGVTLTPDFQNFHIDTNGDGLLDGSDNMHPVPAGIFGPILFPTYRLSPTREYLYIFGTPPGTSSCTGAKIFLYRIPPVDGAPLETLVSQLCIPYGIAIHGFYDDPVNAPDHRLFFAVGNSHPTTLEQQITWVDLNTATNTTTDFPFDRVVTDITFEIEGVAAFVQYDNSDGDNLADYRLIEMCAEDLGTSYNPTGNPFGQVAPPLLEAFSLPTGGGNKDVVVRQSGSPIAQFALDACAGPGPATGACCTSDGNCSDGVTQTACEGAPSPGIWQGAGSSCSSVTCPPPAIPAFTLTAAGPATAPAFVPYPYTLNYQNVGTGPATNVVVVATMPPGVTFSSAGNGGYYEAAFNRVRWDIGSVQASAGGALSFSVEGTCSTGLTTLSIYALYSEETFAVGSPAVQTEVGIDNLDPVTVNVTSTPSTTPVLNGDTLEHHIELVNTGANLHSGLHFSVNVGSVADYDALLEDGGGNVAVVGKILQWEGDVPASGSVDIRFRTVIPDCRHESQIEDRLNFGANINVLTACNNPVGNGPPSPPTPLGPIPVSIGMGGTAGGRLPTPLPDFGGGINALLVRQGSSVELELSIVNNYAETQTGVVASQQMPVGMIPAGNPPWVGTPPAGASWDDATKTVSWSGDLAPMQTVSIVYEGTLPQAGDCKATLFANGGFGACANISSGTMDVWGVEMPPSGDYWVGATAFSGMYTTTVNDSVLAPLDCISYEIFESVGAGVDGDVWVSGFPTMRMNPTTLELEFFGSAFQASMQMDAVRDVAVDPNNGTVYFIGSQDVNLTKQVRVRMYDPQTQVITPLLDDTDPSTHRQAFRGVVDPEGFVAVTTELGVVRIDPNNPGSEIIYSSPLVTGGYFALALDIDGDYLLADYSWGHDVPRALFKVDRATGNFTVEIADLNAYIPSTYPYVGMDTAYNGDLVLGAQQGIPRYLHRSPTPVGSFLLGSYPGSGDVAFIRGQPNAVGDPVPPSAPKWEFALQAPVPNPFNPATTLHFSLERPGRVSLAIYDLRGRHVRTLLDERRPAGTFQITWHGRDERGMSVSSGVYFARLESAEGKRVRKLVLTK